MDPTVLQSPETPVLKHDLGSESSGGKKKTPTYVRATVDQQLHLSTTRTKKEKKKVSIVFHPDGNLVLEPEPTLWPRVSQ